MNDTATSEIMVEFYKQLKKGKTKSEALRFAKLNYFNKHKLSAQSPYYWASIVLIGDNQQMELSENNSPILIVIAVIGLLLITIFLYKRKKI